MFCDTFPVDNAGQPDPVRAPADYFATEVSIRENNKGASVDFKVYEPDLTANPISRPAGDEHVFKAPAGATYAKNQILGYVETVAGSATFMKECK